MRSRAEIEDLLEEVDELYRKFFGNVPWDVLDDDMKSLHNFHAVAIDVLMWALGDSVSTHELTNNFGIAGLIGNRREIGVVVGDTSVRPRIEGEIQLLRDVMNEAIGFDLVSDEYGRFYDSLDSRQRHDYDLCCDASDVLDWLLCEIGTEQFKGDGYLDIEGLTSSHA